MSLPDTVFIFVLALIIFGPKKLPEIGRQIGKLVGEFRRASNEFKYQIEEELRNADVIEKSSSRTSITAAADTTITEVPSSPVSSDASADLPVGQHPNIDNLNTAELNTSGMDLPVLNGAGLKPADIEPATTPRIAPAEGVEARTTLSHAGAAVQQPDPAETVSTLPEAHESGSLHVDNGHSDDRHSVPAEAEITHG